MDAAHPKNPLQVALLRWYEALNAGTTSNFNISLPNSFAFDGENMWVSGPYEVLKFRPSEVQVLGRYAKPVAGGSSIAFDGVNIWAATGNDSVTKFRTINGTVLGTFYVGPGVGKIAFDGTNLWVTNLNGVTKLSVNGAIIGTFGLPGIQETGVGIAFDGTYIWITKFQNESVIKMRGADGSIVAEFPIGGRPGEIAFDGSSVWITLTNWPCIVKWTVDLSAQWCFSGTGDHIVFDGANIWTISFLGIVAKRRASDGVLLWSTQTNTELSAIGFDGVNVWTANDQNGAITKR